MTASLEGRVTIVTGAGAGIGRGTAKVLASRGARVVVVDIDVTRAEADAAEIVALGGRAMAVAGDVAEEDDVAGFVDAALGTFGRIDVLHNNAAITTAEHVNRDSDVARMDVAVWDRTMAVNVRGTMLGCKHVLPHMISAGRGSIINTSSSSAFRGDMGRTAYGTSKAAILALTTYVAAQYGPDGIRCNVIVSRSSSPDGRPANMPAAVVDRMASLRLNVLGRPGVPEDVGRAVAFLASDEAAWITGAVLHVDGGTHSIQPWWSASREVYESELLAGGEDDGTPPEAPET